MNTMPKVRVWDRFVRFFHWALVLTFLGAYVSTESIGWVHKGFGYATVVLVVARTVWGFQGTGHARFASFVPSPKALVQYARALLQRREPRHLGHNPAGSLMVLFLLGMVIAIGVTGWMLTLDAFWGNGTVEDMHVVLVDTTVVAIAVHVSANLYASLRHRENLIASMVTGQKRALDTEAQAPLSPHKGIQP
jgi:cytochrome b